MGWGEGGGGVEVYQTAVGVSLGISLLLSVGLSTTSEQYNYEYIPVR